MSRLRQTEASRLKETVALAGDWLRYAIFVSSLILIVAAVCLGVLVSLQLQHVPDLAYLEHYHPVDAIEIYDRDDALVCAINNQDSRKSVDLRHISRFMQDAVIAAEDRHFYEHHGVNFMSIVRAMTVNLAAHRVVEGGSTITQQLVKNLFFPESGRTLVRKVAEVIVASEIERRYSKEAILAMYLNEIYFGNGAHGIEQAARIYFGKTAADISLSEAAFLASVINAPSINGTVEHRAEALQRQRDILDAMVESGYITDVQDKVARRAPLPFVLRGNRSEEPPFTRYPYYVSYVLNMIHQHFDEAEIRRSGLRVYTNLDPVAQSCAEHVLSEQIKRAPRGIDEEALVSLSVKDGAVRAIVGGAGDFWHSQWNCATNPHTVGSAFKPVVYLTAFLQKVLTPQSVVDDKPLTVNQIDMTYAPKNFDGKFLGKITVRQALARSRNTCAVRVAQMVGVENIVLTAKSLGIDTPIEANLSIALGSCALTPMEMAAAYGTLARGGISIKPWTVRHIDDLNARVLESYGPIACRVLPEQSVACLVDVLQDVVTSGTGTLARLPDRPSAGKTGTADQARDLWFIGFTPDMVTAVWGGNKNNEPIASKHVTGGSVMAAIWRQFNVDYYREAPAPAGELISVKARYDGHQSKLAAPLLASHEETAGAHASRKLPAEPGPQAESSRRSQATDVATAGQSKRSFDSRRLQQRPHFRSDAGVKRPAQPVVVRSSKGITDYAWSR